jgi:hypothetical protein
MKDTFHSLKAVQALAPAVATAAANGATVDLKGFGSALFAINTGAIAGDGDFGVKLQASDTTTSGDFTDVDTSDQLGTVPATLGASTAYRLGYIGSKRYVRIATTKEGGTSIAISAMAILGHAQMEPVA